MTLNAPCVKYVTVESLQCCHWRVEKLLASAWSRKLGERRSCLQYCNLNNFIIIIIIIIIEYILRNFSFRAQNFSPGSLLSCE